MGPSTAPQQYKQPSRKGKKAWRKHVDISEIHSGLEIARDEIIRTGGIITEKSSEELFTIDTTGSEQIRKKVAKVIKPLKADQIIAQRSATPAIDSRKRPLLDTPNSLLDPRSKRRKASYVPFEELERLKGRVSGSYSDDQDRFRTAENIDHDPWADQHAAKDPRFSFLQKDKVRTAPKTLKDAPISLLENGKAMPAVPKPNPGISYNPSFEDWDKLLKEEGDKEVIAEQKRHQEARKEVELRSRIEAAEAEAEAEAERSEYYTEDESVWEGIESEYEGSEWLKKKRPERKTPAERNKVKRRKLAEQEARHQARTAARNDRGLSKDQKISKELTPSPPTTETPQVRAADSSDDEIDDRKLRRRKFGTTSIPEKALEVVLPEELQDSLRLLKPEGNLLKERFRTYQVGGKVETRRPGFQAKKARRKATEKWSYKDWPIPA